MARSEAERRAPTNRARSSGRSTARATSAAAKGTADASRLRRSRALMPGKSFREAILEVIERNISSQAALVTENAMLMTRAP
ncbi:MAG: hypothetical protein DMD83_02000 [Candidatus Rokuibacteriota bacterium]|nr:MAG: hypothetical protein DMD83_02000 [Candidatus Rokubacteria bacterium]